MRTYTPDEMLQEIETWTRYELPAINRQIEGTDEAGVLLNRLKPLLEIVTPLRHQAVGDRVATRLLQCIAFGVSSLERHMQWSGAEPGLAVGALGAADLLLHLARLADQPPRDTYRSYWLDNAGPAPLTFTGTAQEVMFNRVVNETQVLHAASAAALRPLGAGSIALTTPEAVDAMEVAIVNHERLIGLFRSFMLPSIDRPSEWSMTAEFFAYSMRTYLSKYWIAGTPWGGPNAANIPGQVLCDYTIGTVDDDYRAVIRDRCPLLHHRDRVEIEHAMAQPSVLDRILQAVGVDTPDLSRIPDGDLVPRFLAQPELMPALSAFCELIKSAAQLSATHFALIHNYLRRTADQTPPGVRDRLPVKLDHGTGDMSHDGTWRIMQMRKNHPIAARVVAAIRAAA